MVSDFIFHLRDNLAYLRDVKTTNTGGMILKWYITQNRPNRLFRYGEERSIAGDCTHKEKINFEGFTENGCCGNQPQPLEFYLIALTLTCKCKTRFDFQAYLVGLSRSMK